MSPTQRSLAYMKDLGFTCAVVEHWNSFARIRQDMFGVIDVVCLMPGVGVVGVQTTSGSNLAARRTKSLAEPRLRTWLESGGRFELHGWRKIGPRGKRKTWQVVREEVTTKDIIDALGPMPLAG